MNNSIFHPPYTYSQISLALYQKNSIIISIFFHKCSYPSIFYSLRMALQLFKRWLFSFSCSPQRILFTAFSALDTAFFQCTFSPKVW